MSTQPARRLTRTRSCSRLSTYVLAGALIIGTAGAGYGATVESRSSVRLQKTTSASAALDPSTRAHHAVLTAVAKARHHDPLPRHLHPSLANLAGDLAPVGRCDYVKPPTRLCRRGAVKSSRVLVAFGDSHAREWIPALEAIARRIGYATYYLVKPGCTSASVTPAVAGHAFRACVAFHAWAMTQIENLKPDVLVLASRLPRAVVGSAGQIVTQPSEIAPLVRAGFVGTIKAAQTAGVGTIYMVEDAAELPAGISHCLKGRHVDLGTCASPPLSSADLTSTAERDAASRAGARYIHTRLWMCARGLCPAVVGSLITHHDGSHLTTVYPRRLNRALQESMGLHKAAPRGQAVGSTVTDRGSAPS